VALIGFEPPTPRAIDLFGEPAAPRFGFLARLRALAFANSQLLDARAQPLATLVERLTARPQGLPRAAFLGFVFGRVAALQEFGLGLALGVLIDATIVRALLVPALMAVFGRWNWWLPGAGRRR